MLNHPYICLTTATPLSDQNLQSWIEAVIHSAPSGTITATQVPPNNENLCFYRRDLNDKNHYIASLSRDLNNDEATAIAKKFSEITPINNGKITWSQKPYSDDKPQKLSQDIIKAIALEAARMNHNRWVQRKLDEGWRYADQPSNKQRTSPVCRNWDQLPDAYKRAEYQRVSSLLEVLDQMNLRLVRK
jgi:hypothetical protein